MVLDSIPTAALDGRRSQEEINALSVSVWRGLTVEGSIPSCVSGLTLYSVFKHPVVHTKPIDHTTNVV